MLDENDVVVPLDEAIVGGTSSLPPQGHLPRRNRSLKHSWGSGRQAYCTAGKKCQGSLIHCGGEWEAAWSRLEDPDRIYSECIWECGF